MDLTTMRSFMTADVLETRWELSRAWQRVEDKAADVSHTFLTEVMTWEDHQKIWGEHRTLEKPSPDCERYHELVQTLQWRDPTDEEFMWLDQHLRTCTTGRHAFAQHGSDDGHEEEDPTAFMDELKQEIHQLTREKLTLVKS